MTAATPVAADAVARLQAFLDDRVDRFGNIAAVVGIDTPATGRHFLVAGSSEQDGGERPTADHRYQIGSQTKMVTAVAALRLIKDGSLALDEVVADILDVAIDRRIVVEHLLMNTSGLGEFTHAYLGPRYAGAIPLSPLDMIRFAQAQGQFFDPGAQFDYSNVNFVLLGLIVERRSGRSLAAFCHERFLGPAGVDLVFTASEPLPAGAWLHGYLTSARIKPPVDTVDGREAKPFFGTGDIVARPGAMLDFGRMLLDPDDAGGVGLADLSAKTCRAAYAPMLMSHSVGGEYGYGIEVANWAGRDVWGHRGTTFGYQTSTWVDPGTRVVVTTCVTTVHDLADGGISVPRYAAQQVFAMALSTAHLLACFS